MYFGNPYQASICDALSVDVNKVENQAGSCKWAARPLRNTSSSTLRQTLQEFAWRTRVGGIPFNERKFSLQQTRASLRNSQCYFIRYTRSQNPSKDGKVFKAAECFFGASARCVGWKVWQSKIQLFQFVLSMLSFFLNLMSDMEESSAGKYPWRVHDRWQCVNSSLVDEMFKLTSSSLCSRDPDPWLCYLQFEDNGPFNLNIMPRAKFETLNVGDTNQVVLAVRRRPVCPLQFCLGTVLSC